MNGQTILHIIYISNNPNLISKVTIKHTKICPDCSLQCTKIHCQASAPSPLTHPPPPHHSSITCHPYSQKISPLPRFRSRETISLQIHLGQYPSSRIQPLKSIKTATQLVLFHFQSVQLVGEADHEEHIDSSSGGAQGEGEQ